MTERENRPTDAGVLPGSTGRVRRRRLRRGELARSKDTGDPFFETFFSRIPKAVAPTFTAEQLDAVKRAFGARYHGAHAIDVRLSLPLWRRSVYLVFLIGSERRTFDRRSLERLLRQLSTFANAAVLAVFLVMFMGALFAVVYVGKQLVGLDVFPGFDMLPDRAIERLLR